MIGYAIGYATEIVCPYCTRTHKLYGYGTDYSYFECKKTKRLFKVKIDFEVINE